LQVDAFKEEAYTIQMQYVPIQTSTLQSNVPIIFDVYVKIHEKYILLIRQGDDLEEERLKKLTKFEGQRLFILKSEMKNLKNYIGDLLDQTLETKLDDEDADNQDARFFTKGKGSQSNDFRDQTNPKTKSYLSGEKTGAVKLSPQMRNIIGQAQLEESPKEKLIRQAGVVRSVAQTAIDVLNRILQDPDSIVAYQIAAKAAKGIQKVLEANPEIITELYTDHREDGQPLLSHSKNVACLSALLALRNGLPRQEQLHITTAALMHDLGLVKMDGIEDSFMKPKEDFTGTEKDQYLQHSSKGFLLAQEKAFIPEAVCELIKYHEEDLSGRGPEQLTNLTLGQQVLALANRFDKIVLEKKLSTKEAIQHFSVHEIGNYDLKLIESLKKIVIGQKLVSEAWAL